MAKSRKNSEKNTADDGSANGPSTTLRVAIGVAVSWHLLCVFISPFSVRPSSELAERLAQGPWIRWYTDPLYLNHGYHFFGPEPPINQLMRYAVYDENGAELATGEFPNKSEQWPRLYYHRHMMLADQADLAPGQSIEEAVRLSLRSYARHLLRKHDGAEARVNCVRHALLDPQEVLRGVDPNAAETFLPVDSVIERARDLSTPLVGPVRGQGGGESLPFGGGLPQGGSP
ncbi:hypothetical protein [Botrimarina hoheduenensis]|uniref:Uncharacterized protein n=1 Tax=Botrimarina hoheduenensis TaxID=2528000 RepID=A0A5C5VV80_9BACT|nr:hypothetical protein [Botrimarina hoheduenensis]TWT41569.1 hypothetical protein Pla111_29460 [Botrimarina hoheduenensis]